MRGNGYFNSVEQKGFMPRVSGCIEHSTLCYEALRDARRSKRQICVAWIDLRNAFGSVRHNLIQYALQHYSVPLILRKIVFSYYTRLSAAVTVPQTSPFSYDIGVFQGCTLSPTLFNICFQLLLDSLNAPSLAPLAYSFKGSDITVSNTAFADDLCLISRTTHGCQKYINITDDFLTWTDCMAAAPQKCRSSAARLVENRYTCFDPCLVMSKQPIAFIGSNEFKFLGRRLRANCGEDSQRETLFSQTKSQMQIIQETQLEGYEKLWIYHHIFVPKLSWSFQVLELTASFVGELQAVCIKYLKQWAGLPRSSNTAILFIGCRKRFGMRLHHLPTVWRKCQSIKWHLIKTSKDSRMRTLYQLRLENDQKLSRKYAPTVALECAQASAGQTSQPTMGLHQGRSGLGYSVQKHYSKPPRKAVLDTFNTINNEEQLSTLRHLQIQGKWLEWNAVMFQDISWTALLYGGTGRDLKFLLAATQNVLPTPDNLRRWGNTVVDQNCPLCKQRATLRHILGACPTALMQGRYTWRHDNVLSIIVAAIRQALVQRETTPQSLTQHNKHNKMPFITFCKGGSKKHQPSAHTQGLVTSAILSAASDWTLLVDSNTDKVTFPTHIAPTTLRPDIILYSTSRHVVFWLELTVCLEDRFSANSARKIQRYASLAQKCEDNGWTVRDFAVEVGVRGFIPHSLKAALRSLGLHHSEVKRVCRLCSRVAVRSSYVLWLRRRVLDFAESPL